MFRKTNKIFRRDTDGGYVCVRASGWYVCTICVHSCYQKKLSSINYCVMATHISQPRYVMLNLVAKSKREKGEKNYKLLGKARCICGYNTSQCNCTFVLEHMYKLRRKKSYSDRERERRRQTDGASGDIRRYQTSPLITIYYDATIVSCEPC